MKQMTKRLATIAAASALVLAATGSVYAHSGFGPGWGGPQGMMGGPGGMHGPFGGPGRMMGGGPAGYSEQGLAELKSRLGITPEQETAWDAYVTAVQGRAAVMTAHRQAMVAGTVTLEQRQAFHQQGFDQMQKLATATRDLYAVLTPEQKSQAGGLSGRPCAGRWTQ